MAENWPANKKTGRTPFGEHWLATGVWGGGILKKRVQDRKIPWPTILSHSRILRIVLRVPPPYVSP
jgi:hypothetical protein